VQSMSETKDRNYRLNSSTCKRLDIIAMETGDPYVKSEIVDFAINLTCVLISNRQAAGETLKDALEKILALIPEEERSKDFPLPLTVADADINSIFSIITRNNNETQ
jgi:tRNA(Phe) wybutosine-synthesizing methylase Tyw3